MLRRKTGMCWRMTLKRELQSAADQTLWRIISIWKSREALDEMRNSGETPEGVVMFRNVGAEPELSIFNVPASAP